MSEVLHWNKVDRRGSRMGLPLRPRTEDFIRASERDINVARIKRQSLEAANRRHAEDPLLKSIRGAKADVIARAKRVPVTLPKLSCLEKSI